MKPYRYQHKFYFGMLSDKLFACNLNLLGKMKNTLTLVRSFFPVKDILEKIKCSDEKLILQCSDGGYVVTSKMLLSIFSNMIRDMCKDIDELTLILPFPKHLLNTMIMFLISGEVKEIKKKDIENLKCLLRNLGVQHLKIEESVVVKEKPKPCDSLNFKEEPSDYLGTKLTSNEPEASVDIHKYDAYVHSYLEEEAQTYSEEEAIKSTEIHKKINEKNEDKRKIIDMNLQCKVCKTMFEDRGSLFQHKETYHTNKPRKCSYCSKIFFREITLNKHLQSSHKEKENIASIKESNPSSIQFEFLKTGKSDKDKEGVLLTHGCQYKYQFGSGNKTDTRRWYVCARKSRLLCPARATLFKMEVNKDDGEIEFVYTMESISTPQHHNHPPDRITIILNSILEAMKQKVENDPTTSLRKIREDVLAQELQKHEDDQNLVGEILKAMPKRVTSTLNTLRHKVLQTNK